MKCSLNRIWSGLILTSLLLGGVPTEIGAATKRLPKLPRSLDEMLEIALVSNPQVRLAAAKLREAEAVLADARLRVTQQVLEEYSERKTRVLEMESLHQKIATAQRRVSQGVESEEVTYELRYQLGAVEAELTKVEGRLRYLLGTDPRGNSKDTKVWGSGGPGNGEGATGSSRAATGRRPTMSDGFRKILSKKIDVGFEEISLPAAIQFLEDQGASRLPFVLDEESLVAELGDPEDLQFTLRMKETEVSAVLLALSDLYGVAFVARDYGLMVTTPTRAYDLLAPAIPHDLPFDPRFRSPGKSSGAK